MASNKQLTANRLNAMRSTGPKSAEGKARSCQNSITHGLTSTRIVIAGEDEAQFQQLYQGLLDEFLAKKPRGPLELQLIEQLASTLWRLKRIPTIEAALFDFLFRRQQAEASGTAVDAFPTFGVYEDAILDASAGAQSAFGRVCDLIVNRGDSLGKIARYEASLLKQFDYLFKRLMA